MKSIVVVDKNWGIGKNNGLLFSLKKDMAFFRSQTLNKVVCMGKNTLLSFPNAKPLPKRVNIVLSTKEIFDGCIMVKSLDELFEEIKKYPTDDIFFIGGARFYETTLPFVDSVLVTKVDSDGGAEVFFKNLDTDFDWELISESEAIEDNGYTIRFAEYRNKNKKIYGEK